MRLLIICFISFFLLFKAGVQGLVLRETPALWMQCLGRETHNIPIQGYMQFLTKRHKFLPKEYEF